MTPEQLEARIHELTAMQLLRQLSLEDDASPGLLQAALRFLKDNDVTALPIPGSAAERIKDKMGDTLPFQMTGTNDVAPN